MSWFSNMFGGNKYNDTLLVSQAITAINADPLINDPNSLVVTSKNGVMTLSGIVQKTPEKERIEGVIRSSLSAKNLKVERVINELKLPHGAG